MDVRTLSCFIAVADELHFRRAAARVHLTQPALSVRIRGLEDEIGAALLVRDRRHVALTPAGAAFLAYARSAVWQASQGKLEALRASRGERGRLRLGFTVLASYRELPGVVRGFRDRCPLVEIELQEMNSPRLEAALAEGSIDLGLLHPPLGERDLDSLELASEELVLAVPSTHRLATSKRVRLEHLEGEPFLIAPRSVGPHIYDQVVGACRKAGFSPDIVQEATPMTTLIGLVAAGVGIGLVTKSLQVIRRPGVAYRRIDGNPVRLPFAAAWRSGQTSPVVRRFIDMLRRRIR
jgi:DNA-binding transcriptional LysR family regulator